MSRGTALDEAAAAAAACDGRASPALEVAVRLGATTPAPGGGATLARWELLATLGAADLTCARVVEAHLDALAVLDEAGDTGHARDGSTWGVFAAEGPGVRLDATEGPNGWRLTGTKPWCSLADRLSHALVTAHTPDGRRLFAVGLDDAGVDVRTVTWAARGLSDVPSGPVDLTDVRAVPCGASGWYLERPGFAWGGMGVAACWYGGAVGVARRLHAGAAARTPDQVAHVHLGGVDADLAAARAVLREAAETVDGGGAQGTAGVLLAARVRAVAAASAERVLSAAAHALGPGPVTLEEEHARRVADLQVYLRQHHAERDLAALGAELAPGEAPW